jgi:hypothetical protein
LEKNNGDIHESNTWNLVYNRLNLVSYNRTAEL